jgi:hypothetical protein
MTQDVRPTGRTQYARHPAQTINIRASKADLIDKAGLQEDFVDHSPAFE